MSSTVGSRPSKTYPPRKLPRKIYIARGESYRCFTLRPWLTASVGTVVVLFSTLYLGATGYLIFRDDILANSIARQADIRAAYEERIATLNADIDRLTSRQLVNQQAVETAMQRLVGKQAILDARQDIIAGLSQAAKRAGIAPPKPAKAEPVEAEAQPQDGKAPDTITTGSVLPTVGIHAPLAAAMLRTGHPDAPPAPPQAQVQLQTVERSLDTLARDQVAYVDAVAAKADRQSSRLAAALERLGHDVPEPSDDSDSDTGGPFVPLAENADPETFRSGVALVSAQLDRLADIRRVAGALPLTKPISNAPITSRFGARLDPFLRRPALHTGIDFRAASGYPARATAAGKVITAEYTGGYGNMVEIDHGNGVTTRYGHLSKILVRPGTVVSKGAVVGRTGSTGRSTGPHLHYEVRVRGQAIDPLRYIRAGKEIAPLL